MSLLDNLDNLLSRIIRSLERVPDALSAVADYVLHVLTRCVNSILRVVRLAARLAYRFIRDLVTNLLRIAWNVLGLFLIPLFFTFLWGLGRELADAGHNLSGWSLQIAGLASILLFIFALLASFSKRPSGREQANESTKHPHAVFGLLNFIFIIAVTFFSYTHQYKYSNLLLDQTEVSVSRLILWVTSLDGASDDSQLSWLHRAAAISLQQPELPASVAAQVKGSAYFATDSEVVGTLYNPTDWTIVRIRTVFRGPGDKSKPVTWERTCDIEIRLRPHQTREFSCMLEAVDLEHDWRWEPFTLWGFQR